MQNQESIPELPARLIPRLDDDLIDRICGGETEWNEILWERIAAFLVQTTEGNRVLLRLLVLNQERAAKPKGHHE